MNHDQTRNIKGIINFISANKIAAICCTDNSGNPYCFHCFYVFDDKHQLLFFKSSVQSTHSKIIADNPLVAGSILPQKIELMALKGIQFTGTILNKEFPDHINPETYYHKKLPLGITKPGKVYCIRLETIKMTDISNLGKKELWSRLEPELIQ